MSAANTHDSMLLEAVIDDIGCGTGTFACLLARRSLTVTAVDPAEASLAVAGSKPGADRVRWVHGYATDLPRSRRTW